MSDHVAKTPEARWKHLCDRGMLSAVDVSSNKLIDSKPAWLDEARWARAKEAIQKFYVGVVYSSFTGLLMILQLPDGLEPLLSTGNSKDIPSLYKRYLSTIIHVNSWYDDDIFNPETKGYKSIRQVRGMHKRVQNLMNQRCEAPGVDSKPRVWYNAYDVALTQFAFIGLAMLYPEKSGMIAATPEELEGINYYWRVLGYMMGIKDEFNACQFDTYEDIREFNKLILEHEYLDVFKKERCEKGLGMTQSICLAMEYFVPMATFNLIAHWWKDCFKFNGYEPQPMTVREKVLDCFTRLSFNHLMKYEGFIRWSNKKHKALFEKRLKNKDKVYKSLQKKYKDCPHLTYYSDRVDYFKTNNGDLKQSVTNDTNDLQPDDAKNKSFVGCPFGYEAIIPSPPMNMNHETSTIVAPA